MALPWRPIDGEGRYQGSVDAEGARHGAGRMEWLAPSEYAGDSYVGQWRRGAMHGRGRLVLANGNWYDGDLAENISHGHGTYYWAATRTRYEGAWKKDACHGFGVWTWGARHAFAKSTQYDINPGDQFAGFCRRRDALDVGSKVELRLGASTVRVEALAADCLPWPAPSSSVGVVGVDADEAAAAAAGSDRGESENEVDGFGAIADRCDALLVDGGDAAFVPTTLVEARGVVLGRSRQRGQRWIVSFRERGWVVRVEKDALRLTDVDDADTATALHGFGWFFTNLRGVGFDRDIDLPVNVNGYVNKTVRNKKDGAANGGVLPTRAWDDHKDAKGVPVPLKKSWRRRAKLKKSQTECQQQCWICAKAVTRAQWSAHQGKICSGCNMVLHVECIRAISGEDATAEAASAAAEADAAAAASASSRPNRRALRRRPQWFCPFVPLCRELSCVCTAVPPRRLALPKDSDPPAAPRDGAPLIPVEGLHSSTTSSGATGEEGGEAAEEDGAGASSSRRSGAAAGVMTVVAPFARDPVALREQAIALTEPCPLAAELRSAEERAAKREAKRVGREAKRAAREVKRAAKRATREAKRAGAHPSAAKVPSSRAAAVAAGRAAEEEMPILSKAYMQRAKRRTHGTKQVASRGGARSDDAKPPNAQAPSLSSSSDSDSNDDMTLAQLIPQHLQRRQIRTKIAAASAPMMTAASAAATTEGAGAAVGALSSDEDDDDDLDDLDDDVSSSDDDISDSEASPRKRAKRGARRIRHALSSSDDEEEEEEEAAAADLFSSERAAKERSSVALSAHSEPSSTPLLAMRPPQHWIMGPAARVSLQSTSWSHSSARGAARAADGASTAAAAAADGDVPSLASISTIALPALGDIAERCAAPPRGGASATEPRPHTPRPLPMIVDVFGVRLCRGESWRAHLPAVIASCGRAIGGIERALLRAESLVGADEGVDGGEDAAEEAVESAVAQVDEVARSFDILQRWSAGLVQGGAQGDAREQLEVLEMLLAPCIRSFFPIGGWSCSVVGVLAAPLLRLTLAVHALLLRLNLSMRRGAASEWRLDVSLRQLLLTLHWRPELAQLHGSTEQPQPRDDDADNVSAVLGWWRCLIASLDAHAEEGGVSGGYWGSVNALLANFAALPRSLDEVAGRSGGRDEATADTKEASRRSGVRFAWATLVRATELYQYDAASVGGAAAAAVGFKRGPLLSVLPPNAARRPHSNWQFVRSLLESEGEGAKDGGGCAGAAEARRRCGALAVQWRVPTLASDEEEALRAVLVRLRASGALRAEEGLAALRCDGLL